LTVWSTCAGPDGAASATPASTKAAEANATAEIATVANDFGALTFKCWVVLMARSFALMATMLAAMA
jgi:hypothetical protein